MPDLITVHAGTLDEPEHFTPQVLTYSARGLGWDVVDSSMRVFEGMPLG